VAGYGFPTSLTTDKKSWLTFANGLIKVLEDQPIVEPTPEIAKVWYEPAAPGSVLFVIGFAQPIGGFPSYRYGNVLY
jgi:hypothetical protein